jgi:MoaA/NifB/PqqE/SkfB family radical SAM enzyme
VSRLPGGASAFVRVLGYNPPVNGASSGPEPPQERTAKVVAHEAAAHQKRNWVRLTFDCNDHCVFCLDAHTHDGTYRDRDEIKAQILDGRRKGAERLILSGGEPTIHPNFVDFVRLGSLAGYERVQTVTNGRLFAYPDFLRKSLDAGLGEITFSIHGPNAQVHDALVGTKGAFDQEIKGLELALRDGRPIINIDICVNRGNVKHLPAMLKKFTEMGVLEYDLLHVIPFGRAYTEGKETLFYDLEQMRPYLLEAFAYSKRPNVHIWLNRFPPQHLEGYEHLIQDPYKLNDEIRGRKEEYGYLLEKGVPLDCRAPHRCSHCYLEPVCDRLDERRQVLADRGFEVFRVDTEWDAKLPPVYGGDPASRTRSESREARGVDDQVIAEAAAAVSKPAERRRLPMYGMGASPSYLRPAELVARAGVRRLWVAAPTLEAAVQEAAKYRGPTELALELGDHGTLFEALESGRHFTDLKLCQVVVDDHEDAKRLLELAGELEVVLRLNRSNVAWLLSLSEAPAGLVIRQPTHARLTESANADVDLVAFFRELKCEIPFESIPACVAGRPPRAVPETFDGSMLDAAGHLEIFRYVKKYIQDHYFTKSLRCKTCVHDSSCQGVHVNYVRAHGYACMQPISVAAATE